MNEEPSFRTRARRREGEGSCIRHSPFGIFDEEWFDIESPVHQECTIYYRYEGVPLPGDEANCRIPALSS